jgi:hypothetical protein
MNNRIPQSRLKSNALIPCIFVLIFNISTTTLIDAQTTKHHFKENGEPAMMAYPVESWYTNFFTFCNYVNDDEFTFIFRTLKKNFITKAYPDGKSSVIENAAWEIVNYESLDKSSFESWLTLDDKEYELTDMISTKKAFILTFNDNQEEISFIYPVSIYAKYPHKSIVK